MAREKNEIEALKANWKRDPIWNIEETEGFEEHRDELLTYRKEQEALWKEQSEKHRAILASKICPLRSSSYKGAYDQDQYEDLSCLVENCAWWNDTMEKCGIVVESYLRGLQVAREER